MTKNLGETTIKGMKTIGSLFSGYGGLDLGVQLALGPMRTAWVSDIEPGPKAILAQRFPDAPNLGDITEIDWSQVEPVDILTGGSPCQDLSTAGQRAGMMPGTRSGLWESMAHAIEQLQPRLVVWENVKGAYSADAYCDMGWSEGFVDERTPAQRPKTEKGKPLRALGRVLGDLAELGYDARWTSVRASSVGAPHQRERVFVVAYPRSEGLGWDWAERGQEKDTSDERGVRSFSLEDWGKYTLAVEKWAQVLDREPPEPTVTNQKGNPHLSPFFVEWVMGLPKGWVTDIPISRAQQIRALGNGVVPQQAALAIRSLI